MRTFYAVSEIGLGQCKKFLSSIRSWPDEAHQRAGFMVAGLDGEQDVDDVESSAFGKLFGPIDAYAGPPVDQAFRGIRKCGITAWRPYEIGEEFRESRVAERVQAVVDRDRSWSDYDGDKSHWCRRRGG